MNLNCRMCVCVKDFNAVEEFRAIASNNKANKYLSTLKIISNQLFCLPASDRPRKKAAIINKMKLFGFNFQTFAPLRDNVGCTAVSVYIT